MKYKKTKKDFYLRTRVEDFKYDRLAVYHGLVLVSILYKYGKNSVKNK